MTERAAVKLKAETSSERKIASLQALLARKKEDALRLELQVIELDRQNNRLKEKRAADGVRIEALEAQIQGYPNAFGVKREVSGQASTRSRLLIYPYSPA
jgi:predicted  nucleic acid-binding Zn-ribbon protein